MSKFVLSFRAPTGRTPDAAEEEAWGRWFGTIGASIVDFGHRVGAVQALGAGPDGHVLGGYVVIQADDLAAAARVAEGCPGLRHGGGVEVGEAIQMR